MSKPVLILPTSLEYGYVDARIILAVADTDDEDRLPNAVPATGTITLTPLNDKTVETEEEPVIVGRHSISGTLDATGRLRDSQGQRGLWVITGLYSVSYKLTGVSVGGHRVLVTSDHTENNPLHLATAAQPTAGPITPTEYQQLSARIDALGSGGGGGAGAVSSVNGKTGTVVLSAADVGAATAAQGVKADTAVQPADVGDVVREGDSRLTDARTPKAHTHTASEVSGLPGPQTLSISGSNLTLSGGGGTVTLPSGGGGGGGGASRYGVPTFGLSGVLVWNFRDMSDSIEAANGTALLTRVILADETLIKAIGMQVHATGSTGAVIRVSLYAPDGAGGGPGTLIVDAGTVDATTGGWKEATFTAVTAPAGPVWVALTTQGSPATLPRIAGGNAPAHLALTSPADFVGPSGIAQGAGMTGPAASTWAYTIAVPTGQTAPSVALRTA